MKISDVYDNLKLELSKITEEYNYEAKSIIEFVLNKNIYNIDLSEDIDTNSLLIIDKFLNDRKNRKPLQYIQNKAYLYGYEFYVDERVLIPRYDTENLVYSVLKYIKDNDKILELCVGSGAVILSISLENKFRGEYVASDISKAALEVAKINASKYNKNIKFIESDMFENIDEKFDIIVANPPYIPYDDKKTLENELFFEPEIALFAEDEGLYFYKKIIRDLDKYLSNNGMIFFEVGYNQAEIVGSLLENKGFDVEFEKDIHGILRVVIGKRRKNV